MNCKYIFLCISIYCTNALSSNPFMFRQVHKIHKNIFNKNRKIFMIDIDGTICTKTNSEYNSCIPIYKNIEKFNHLYDEGHEVHYWTARGANSGKKWDKLTIQQLKEWCVKYDTINMGKPHYDVWIDDKAINVNDFYL